MAAGQSRTRVYAPQSPRPKASKPRSTGAQPGLEQGPKPLPAELAGLQRTAGNEAVTSLIHSMQRAPSAATQLDIPRPSVRREREWAQQNPGGRVDDIEQDHFLLSNFSVNDYQLKPEHQAKLDALIKEWPILGAGPTSIQLDGHASGSGIASRNDVLAKKRAEVVRAYLVQHGVPGTRISIKAHGSASPNIPNLTPGSMSRNRRVEVNVINPYRGPAPKSDVTLTGEPVKPGEEIEPAAGGWVEAKVKYDWPIPRVIPPYFNVWPGIEGSVKLKTRGHPAMASGVTIDVLHLQVVPALKASLSEDVDVKFDGKSLTMAYKGMPFVTPEFGPQADPIKPIIIKVGPAKPLKQTLSLGGVDYDAEYNVKLRLQVGPAIQQSLLAAAEASEAAALGVGASVAEIGGVVFVAVGAAIYISVILPATAIAEAKQQGEEKVNGMARRDGYAWKLAEMASGRAKEAVDQSRAWGGTARDAFVEGWARAQAGVHALTPEQQDAFFKALKKEAHSEIAEDIAKLIKLRMGPTTPADPRVILAP